MPPELYSILKSAPAGLPHYAISACRKMALIAPPFLPTPIPIGIRGRSSLPVSARSLRMRGVGGGPSVERGTGPLQWKCRRDWRLPAAEQAMGAVHLNEKENRRK